MLDRLRIVACSLLCVGPVACGDDESTNPFGPTGTLPGDTGNDADTSAGATAGTPPETTDGSTDGPAASTGSDASTDSGPLVPVTILNGSFEQTSFEPGCYDNLTNEELTMAVDDVTAFGTADQIDFYHDCYGVTQDGVFHVGLGAYQDTSDAIALSLSGPLDLGYGNGYRLRFWADYGETGAETTTNVQIGVSSDPTQFGVMVAETGQLNDDPTEYEIVITDEGSSYITVQVEPDGDYGWAMIDNFRLEPIE